MKQEINAAVHKATKVGEIFLFREMATSLNKHARAVFVREMHGRKGWVEFSSTITNRMARKEISDLMILVFNKAKNEAKLCFLQAKYHRTSRLPFLKFHGDYLQLELLKDRPKIHPRNYFGFPDNILQFSPNYRSLTTYGVFYHDSSGNIDMLYTVAKYLSMVGSNGTRGDICFPGGIICHRRPHCLTRSNLELLTTYSIDKFESELLAYEIGAPINHNSKVFAFVNDLLRRAVTLITGSDADFINEIIDSLGGEVSAPSQDEMPRGVPNLLVLQIGEERGERGPMVLNGDKEPEQQEDMGMESIIEKLQRSTPDL